MSATVINRLDQPASGPAIPAEFKRTRIYQELMAEREAILQHKWCESEKAGHDIGIDRAVTSWLVRHRRNWIRGRRQAL